MYFSRLLLCSWRRKSRISVINPKITSVKGEEKWKTIIKVLKFKYDEYPLKKLAWIAGVGFVISVLSFTAKLQYVQYKWRTSEAVMLSLQKLNDEEKLICYLGSPLKIGWVYPQNNNSISHDRFHASIQVTGVHLDGYLKIEANRKLNTWELDDVQFVFTDKSGGIVQLLKKS